MGTGRTFRKISRTRPKKSPGDQRRRQKVQKKRLVALGVPEAEAVKMGPYKVREMLRRPAAIKAKKA